MRTITLLICALTLTLGSCTKEDLGPQEYLIVVDTSSKSKNNIILNESLEDWTSRVLENLETDEILVTEHWIEKPEGPHLCGCWDCQVSGVSLHIITETDPDKVRETGFVLN